MVRRCRSGIAAGAMCLLVAGCGSGGSVGGGTTACTQGANSGAAKTCLETYSSYVVSGGTAQAKADCTSGGGVASDTCSHVGADGGCKLTGSSGGITFTYTTWTYSGNAADASAQMAVCLSAGNVWVAP